MAIRSYKQRRQPRQIVEQVPFNRGMFYSEQVQDRSFAKLLVNYEIIDKGKALRTRKGVSSQDTHYKLGDNLESDWAPARASVSHFAGLMNYEKENGGSEIHDTVVGLGVPEPDIFSTTTNQKENLKLQRTLWSNLDGLEFQYNNKLRKYEGDTSWIYIQDNEGRTCFAGLDTLKGVRAVEIVTGELRPVHTVMEGYLYVLGTTELPEQLEDEGAYSWKDPKFQILRLEGTQATDPLALDVSFEVNEIEPYEPRVSETYSVGFNMLLEEPFVLKNIQSSTHDILGVLSYKIKEGGQLGDPVYSPNPGEEVRYRAFLRYATGKNYEIKWSRQNVNTADPDVWEDLTKWEKLSSLTVDTVVYYDFATSYPTNLRVQFREQDVEDSVLSLPITIIPGVEKFQDFKEIKYDLTTAKGMFEYQGRLGLYGVEGFEHGIFYSVVGNSGYFPYPYNTDWVDGTILNVVNYLDSLLIITTHSIYIVQGQGLIMEHTRKKILSNLNIKPLDALNIKVIKDQIFFKSDGKYYVLKPNLYTSDFSDLRSFEISTPIQNFLDDFDEIAEDTLRRMYGQEYINEEV